MGLKSDENAEIAFYSYLRMQFPGDVRVTTYWDYPTYCLCGRANVRVKDRILGCNYGITGDQLQFSDVRMLYKHVAIRIRRELERAVANEFLGTATYG